MPFISYPKHLYNLKVTTFTHVFIQKFFFNFCFIFEINIQVNFWIWWKVKFVLISPYNYWSCSSFDEDVFFLIKWAQHFIKSQLPNIYLLTSESSILSFMYMCILILLMHHYICPSIIACYFTHCTGMPGRAVGHQKIQENRNSLYEIRFTNTLTGKDVDNWGIFAEKERDR